MASNVTDIANATTRAFALTDTGNAERFAAQHHDKARYVKAWRQWRTWDGRCWSEDERGAVELFAKDTARSIDDEVRQCTDDDDKRKLLRKHAAMTESQNGRKAMLQLAQCELAAVPADFDRDDMLFNVTNGTIDLRTGDLRPHRREDMITHCVNVAWNVEATCPTFESFLARALSASPELLCFVQKAIGYSLTGNVSEQCLFLLHGEGANGKSTLAELLLYLMGPYGKAGAPDLLMARQSDQHSTEQADLKAARLVVCQEVAEGRSWNEKTLKHLTGGDRIKARLMHQDFSEFQPTHKFWICANSKPKMRENGLAVWRRMRLIPFNAVIPVAERDPMLGAKLQAEASGILTWAVVGCLLWQEEGLTAPTAVTTATDSYRAESDHIGNFVEDRLELGDDHQVTKADLYAAYVAWCRANGETAVGRDVLARRLRACGLREGRTMHGRFMVGASLRRALSVVNGAMTT